MNNNYFRITAYYPKDNFSFIVDSNGTFEKLWQFSAYLISKGIKVIEASKQEQMLDINIEPAPQESVFFPMGNFNPDTWFNDMIGVTKDRMKKPQKVVFKAYPKEAPYIRTKPLHKSQMVIEADEEGYTTFQLTVIVNPELERDLMAYGEGIKVLAPKALVASIAKRHKDAALHYQE